MSDYNESNLNPENNINNVSGNENENANSVNPNYNNPYFQYSP